MKGKVPKQKRTQKSGGGLKQLEKAQSVLHSAESQRRLLDPSTQIRWVPLGSLKNGALIECLNSTPDLEV